MDTLKLPTQLDKQRIPKQKNVVVPGRQKMITIIILREPQIMEIAERTEKGVSFKIQNL